MSDVFDDTRLDDPDVLASADPPLRRLAEAGARVRTEAGESAAALELLERDSVPRAIVAAGADARLLRAVLEPWCPVPFVAWPGPSLPGWAGALDLVIVLAPGGGDVPAFSAVREAVRRGCSLITACPPHSVLAEHAAGRHSTQLPTQTDDTLAVAVVMLQGLHRMGIGPDIDPDQVARVLDDVAIACAPMCDIANNPAKELALALGDSTPLVWGGSVLAARAARRVAEAVRRTTGRPALAADAEHLHPVLAATRSRDLFADPIAEGGALPLRPALLILDDGTEEASIREQRGWLTSTAEGRDVHAQTITAVEGPEVARYAALLSTGLYTATYLGIGLDSSDGTGRDGVAGTGP
jgi:Bacterial phospho-glucose isomerase C-terminal SIS domain